LPDLPELPDSLFTAYTEAFAFYTVLWHGDERVTQDHYEGAMPKEALKGMKMLEAQVTSTKLPS
jgi:hypothetical protein